MSVLGRYSVLLFAVVLFYGAAAQPTPTDLEGLPVEPFAERTVLIFTRTDCPISNRYAPEIERLNAKYTAKGFRFWLVYVNPQESLDAIRTHRREHQTSIAGLFDPNHKMVQLAGARVTPEAALFIGKRLVYRGRIDDRYVTFGTTRPVPRVHDLEQALERILSGRNVELQTTKAVGCFIEDLR